MHYYRNPSPCLVDFPSVLRWLGIRFAIVLALIGCLATSFITAGLPNVDVPQGDIVLNDSASGAGQPSVSNAAAVSGADEACRLRGASQLIGTDAISCPVVHVEGTQTDRCTWVDADLPERVRFGIWIRDIRSIATDVWDHDLTTLLRMHVRLQV